MNWNYAATYHGGGDVERPKPLYEIRENKFYSFDVYDLRFAEGRWLVCFRMFKDALAWADAQMTVTSGNREGK